MHYSSSLTSHFVIQDSNKELMLTYRLAHKDNHQIVTAEYEIAQGPPFYDHHLDIFNKVSSFYET